MLEKQLVKGSLKPMILKLLKENGKMYGYEITQMVEKSTQGQIVMNFGALYPILHKLENEGDVETESIIVNNRTRVYYKLTKKGNNTAMEKIKELQDYVSTLTQFLNTDFNYGLA
ncbi:MAG: PadR family transcriptional regulator [Bacteroidales bacterium]|nr:PadR family transcriptional regulator [Bacteroidales bacterium]